MPRPRLLIALLAVATVLVDLVAWSYYASVFWREPGPPGSSGPPGSYWGLWSIMLAQVSLAAIWIAYGGKWRPWLALALVVGVVCWLRLVSPALPDTSPEYSMIMSVYFLLQATVIVAALGIAGTAGVSVVAPPPRAFSVEAMDRRPRLQFSLGYLLAWVTAMAVALGSLGTVLDYREIPPWFRDNWAECATFSVGNAAIALAALWFMLGVRTAMLRTIVLCLTALATSAVWHFAFAPPPDVWIIPSIVLTQILWLLASLAAVRVAGYRLA